jgi:hypothetical protein
MQVARSQSPLESPLISILVETACGPRRVGARAGPTRSGFLSVAPRFFNLCVAPLQPYFSQNPLVAHDPTFCLARAQQMVALTLKRDRRTRLVSLLIDLESGEQSE